MKKRLILLSACLVLIASLAAYANGVLQLSVGESVNVSGMTVSCNAGPASTPKPSGDVYVPGSSVLTDGELITVTLGPASQGILTYGSTGRQVDIGGKIHDPVVFVDAKGTLRILAIGGDNRVWSRTDDTASHWYSLYAEFLETPFVAIVGAQTFLIGRRADTSVHYFEIEHGAWTDMEMNSSAPIDVTKEDETVIIRAYDASGQAYENTLPTGWIKR